MEVYELDLEKYTSNLFRNSQDVKTDLSFIKKKWQQCSDILSRLIDREISKKGSVFNDDDLPPSTELIENVRSRWHFIWKEIKRIEEVKALFEYESLGVKEVLAGLEPPVFLLPNNEEIEYINSLRSVIFEDLKKGFERILQSSSMLEIDIINEKIKDVKYCFSEFYESGEPIKINSVLGVDISNFNLARDLGKFDFVQYLKGRKNDLLEIGLIGKQDDLKREIKSLSQVIMLLYEVGFFDLPILKNISSDNKRGELVNKILRINDDNTRKYITGLQNKDKNYNPLKHKELCKEVVKDYILG